MSTPSQMRKVKVWRLPIRVQHGEPVFRGDWYMGEDWKKESWPQDTVVEVREIFFSMIWRSRIEGKGRTAVYSRQLWTMKSRREAQVLYANGGHQFPGHYKYDESAYDDEIEPANNPD